MKRRSDSKRNSMVLSNEHWIYGIVAHVYKQYIKYILTPFWHCYMVLFCTVELDLLISYPRHGQHQGSRYEKLSLLARLSYMEKISTINLWGAYQVEFSLSVDNMWQILGDPCNEKLKRILRGYSPQNIHIHLFCNDCLYSTVIWCSFMKQPQLVQRKHLPSLNIIHKTLQFVPSLQDS